LGGSCEYPDNKTWVKLNKGPWSEYEMVKPKGVKPKEIKQEEEKKSEETEVVNAQLGSAVVNAQVEQKAEDEVKEEKLSEEEIKTLAGTWTDMAFENYDKDKNGVIDINSEATEFINFYVELLDEVIFKIPKGTVKSEEDLKNERELIIQNMDPNKDGAMDR
jgi:hypothetical protein